MARTPWLIDLCITLGWVINEEKSDLAPTQLAVYLGIMLDTRLSLAFPSHPLLDKWCSLGKEFLAGSVQPAMQGLRILGHLVSLEKLIRYGRVRIRPMQQQLSSCWNQRSGQPVLLDQGTRQAILW